MKHKLLLCILILVVVGLYCQNCIEHLENSENSENSENKIQNLISKAIKTQLQKIYGEFIDAKVNEKLEKIKCKQGPQGPKGDVGDKTSSYQGLYCQGNPTQPISIPNINTSQPLNSIVVLRPPLSKNKESDRDNKDFFILTNKERWQYTQKNQIKTAYMKETSGKTDEPIESDYGICYNDNKEVFVCNTNDNKSDKQKFYSEFNYTNDNEFRTSESDKSNMCLTLSGLTDRATLGNKSNDKNNNKKQQVILSECAKKKDDPYQKFFLH